MEGKHYRVINAACEPKPDPLPRIMVGGEQPRMLRLIARHADEWNISQEDIAHYRDLVKESEKACAAVGRDPATLRRSWFGGCLCVPEGTDMNSVDLSHIHSPNPLIGTPKQIIEQDALPLRQPKKNAGLTGRMQLPHRAPVFVPQEVSRFHVAVKSGCCISLSIC